MEEGEGTSQRTCMYDQCTWAPAWGLLEGGKAGWRWAKKERVETTVIA